MSNHALDSLKSPAGPLPSVCYFFVFLLQNFVINVHYCSKTYLSPCFCLRPLSLILPSEEARIEIAADPHGYGFAAGN